MELKINEIEIRSTWSKEAYTLRVGSTYYFGAPRRNMVIFERFTIDRIVVGDFGVSIAGYEGDDPKANRALIASGIDVHLMNGAIFTELLDSDKERLK
jgi:hypothetical protein